MSYRRFNKSGWVAKSPFLAKKGCKNCLIKKLKRTFFIKGTFLNRRLLKNDPFLSIVMFHMINVKRVVL